MCSDSSTHCWPSACMMFSSSSCAMLRVCVSAPPCSALCVCTQARRAERQQRFASDLASIKAADSSNAGSSAGHAAGGKQRGGGGGRGTTQGGFGASSSGSGSSWAESERAIGSGWLALHGGFGTSTALEKDYLRLTSVPKAEDVRPPEVGVLYEHKECVCECDCGIAGP